MGKKCGFCGEMVPTEAIECPMCGRGMFESDKLYSETPPTSKEMGSNLRLTVVYVINRGRRGDEIFGNDKDYVTFVDLIKEIVLMSNHYHLLVQTPDSNISRAMRHLNGVIIVMVNFLGVDSRQSLHLAELLIESNMR